LIYYKGYQNNEYGQTAHPSQRLPAQPVPQLLSHRTQEGQPGAKHPTNHPQSLEESREGIRELEKSLRVAQGKGGNLHR
jgi:hypothetical protein